MQITSSNQAFQLTVISAFKYTMFGLTITYLNNSFIVFQGFTCFVKHIIWLQLQLISRKIWFFLVHSFHGNVTLRRLFYSFFHDSSCSSLVIASSMSSVGIFHFISLVLSFRVFFDGIFTNKNKTVCENHPKSSTGAVSCFQ